MRNIRSYPPRAKTEEVPQTHVYGALTRMGYQGHAGAQEQAFSPASLRDGQRLSASAATLTTLEADGAVSSVLIVAPHPLVLEIMTRVTQTEFPAAMIRVTGSLHEAQAIASCALTVDLVLLDLGMPGCGGIGALVQLRRAAPIPAVVVFSANEERPLVLAALEAGAKGYIPMTSSPALISAALRIVAAGGVYVPPQALADGSMGEPTLVALTERQREVLRLIVRGLCNKEIAKELRIAKDTVKQHAKAVYAALGIRSRAQAARAAERWGIRLD